MTNKYYKPKKGNGGRRRQRVVHDDDDASVDDGDSRPMSREQQRRNRPQERQAKSRQQQERPARDRADSYEDRMQEVELRYRQRQFAVANTRSSDIYDVDEASESSASSTTESDSDDSAGEQPAPQKAKKTRQEQKTPASRGLTDWADDDYDYGNNSGSSSSEEKSDKSDGNGSGNDDDDDDDDDSSTYQGLNTNYYQEEEDDIEALFFGNRRPGKRRGEVRHSADDGKEPRGDNDPVQREVFRQHSTRLVYGDEVNNDLHESDLESSDWDWDDEQDYSSESSILGEEDADYLFDDDDDTAAYLEQHTKSKDKAATTETEKARHISTDALRKASAAIAAEKDDDIELSDEAILREMDQEEDTILETKLNASTLDGEEVSDEEAQADGQGKASYGGGLISDVRAADPSKLRRTSSVPLPERDMIVAINPNLLNSDSSDLATASTSIENPNVTFNPAIYFTLARAGHHQKLLREKKNLRQRLEEEEKAAEEEENIYKEIDALKTRETDTDIEYALVGEGHEMFATLDRQEAEGPDDSTTAADGMQRQASRASIDSTRVGQQAPAAVVDDQTRASFDDGTINYLNHRKSVHARKLKDIPRYCPGKTAHYTCWDDVKCTHWPLNVRTEEGRRGEEFVHVGMNRALAKRRGRLARLDRKEKKKEIERTKRIHARHRAGQKTTSINFFEKKYYQLVVWRTRVWRSLKEYLAGFELFKAYLHAVEGKYGTVIYQFFAFNRWLFILNTVFALIWFLLLVLPQTLNFESNLGMFEPQDLITGSGYFFNSTAYIGAYTNGTISFGSVEWDMPIFYLGVTLFSYFVVMFVIVVRMLQRHFKSISSQHDGSNLYPFANAVFSSWDFCVFNDRSKRLRQRQIGNQFKDILFIRGLDERSRSRKLALFFWRLALSGVIVGLIGGFLYAVSYLADTYSSSTEVIEQIAATLLATVGSSILPTAILMILNAQKWESRATVVKLLIFWSFLVKMGPIYVILTASLRLEGDSSIQCWESEVGVDLAQLVAANLIVTVASTLGGDIGRYIVDRHATLKRTFQKFVGEPTFQISKSTIDLVYNQALIWIAAFFSPIATVYALVIMLIIFWVKYFSLWKFLKPYSGVFVVKSDDNYTLFMLLITLFLCVIAIGYSVLFLRPSESCTPFRGRETAWSVVQERLETWSTDLQAAVSFINSPAFVIPLLIALTLGVYYLWMVERATARQVHITQHKIEKQQDMKRRLIVRLQVKLKRSRRRPRKKKTAKYIRGDSRQKKSKKSRK